MLVKSEFYCSILTSSKYNRSINVHSNPPQDKSTPLVLDDTILKYDVCVVIGELQAQVSRLAESERSCREQVVAGNSRNTALKAKLSTSQRDLEAVQAQLQESSQRVKMLELEKNR